MTEPTRDNPLKLNLNAPAPNGPPASLSDRVRSLRLPKNERGPASLASYLPWIFCVFLVVLAGYAALQSHLTAANVENLQANLVEMVRNAKKESDATVPDVQPGQQGQAQGPGVPAGAVVLASKGYIVAVQQIQVSPKVGGMLLSLKFKENDRVAKDAILAEIETIDYRADYDHAVAIFETAWQRYREVYFGWRPEEIAQTKAELDEAEIQREQLYQAFKRSSDLNKGRALAAQEYEQALSQFQAMDRRAERLRLTYKLYQLGPRSERVDAAAAEWMQAFADMKKSKWRLDNCTVRAPIDGIILTKRAEEGSQVNPAAFSNGVSASLCDMADLTNMEVDLSISERDIGRLINFKTMKCQVKSEAFPERVYAGYISRIMPIADRSKGAVPVRVKIVIPKEEEGRYLRPDMSAIVTFLNAEYDAPAAVKAGERGALAP